MKGYLNLPDATKSCITDDCLFRTGDIGHFDKDGWFYITDRLKELIKVKGLQVAPAELEALLVTHKKIADAAVIGVTDERLGEAPRAYVVKNDSSLQEREVEEYIARRVAKHKHLVGGVQFVDAILSLLLGRFCAVY
ncbi:Probable 4-coumarate--CoA ligase 2 [Geodia barretti]|uniref:Probable 4-coumarate--CoA ligase 2 n=1 Tax=Geodia barretti TaxID=519541 RepID=A0AA35X1D6_GEOBA|nr:Probable 4-coumarate--CoA ligase 2 [Geodia barretti]